MPPPGAVRSRGIKEGTKVEFRARFCHGVTTRPCNRYAIVLGRWSRKATGNKVKY
jgi:hypothetical protein